MKDYVVTFEIDGELHQLVFSDDINSSFAREKNARIWISDYIKQNFRDERKMYRIISINPVSL